MGNLSSVRSIQSSTPKMGKAKNSNMSKPQSKTKEQSQPQPQGQTKPQGQQKSDNQPKPERILDEQDDGGVYKGP